MVCHALLRRVDCWHIVVRRALVSARSLDAAVGFLAGLLHLIPNFGIVIALIGPAITAAIAGGWTRFLYVLILYAAIVIIGALLIQPWLLKGVACVPFWISLVAPLALGLLFSFWGVLLAPPILAVIYTYRAHHRRRNSAAAPH
jgi:predicted PurR-regulated permease PerM